MKVAMKTLKQLLMKKNCRELKESIRMIKSQRTDTEKNNLIEEVKRKGLMKLLYKMKLSIII